MNITTISQLDMSAIRQTIAEVLSLPNEKVLDADLVTDDVNLESFITVGRVESQSVGNEYKFDDETETESITINRLTLFSVNAYGENAYLTIEKLAGAIRTSHAQSLLKRNGATVSTTSNIKNVPIAIAGGFQQKAQIDLTISHIHRIETQVNRVKTVDIHLNEEK